MSKQGKKQGQGQGAPPKAPPLSDLGAQLQSLAQRQHVDQARKLGGRPHAALLLCQQARLTLHRRAAALDVCRCWLPTAAARARS